MKKYRLIKFTEWSEDAWKTYYGLERWGRGLFFMGWQPICLRTDIWCVLPSVEIAKRYLDGLKEQYTLEVIE
jgi:hypothetical protein